jgi:hypothetical protein
MLDAIIFILIGVNIGYVLHIAKDMWEESHDLD